MKPVDIKSNTCIDYTLLYTLCLGNVPKDFAINKLKKTGLNGVVKLSFFSFNPIDTNDILDIHKYLMKRT